MIISNFTIGADPELFLKNKENKLTSVVGLIGGSKHFPMPIGEGCAIQEDNVAAEFCIPPCDTAELFVKSINYALTDINSRAEALGLTLASLTASGTFDLDQLQTKQAKEFGCDPDFNAYTKSPNPRPRTKNKQLRSAGGHVHVGTTQNPFEVVKTMDLMLGIPSLLIDDDEERRKLYGKAGCLRVKPYGLEYRTLSNFWIWKDETIEWVYHQTKKSLEMSEEYNKSLTDLDEQIIQDCINSNNKALAKSFVTQYNIELP